MLEYQVKKLGTLKFSRLRAISVLRKHLNSYDYSYTMSEVRELLDSVLNNSFEEKFNLKYKVSFDKVFNDNEYIEFDDRPIERSFPEDWIPPFA